METDERDGLEGSEADSGADLAGDTNPGKKHKKRKSAKTRRRIMDTAADLIAERGNTVFKMSEVSGLCGMSKGALYYYFSDRQDLVREIFKEQMTELVEELEHQATIGDPGRDTLRRMCHAFVRRVDKGGLLGMALVRELALARDQPDMGENLLMSRIVGIIAEQLAHSMRKGTVRPEIDAHSAAVVICGAFTFAAVSATDADRADGHLAERLADGLLDCGERGIGT